MERVAQRIGFGQDRPSLLSTVGACWRLPAHVASGLTEYDELKGLTWKWQAADGAMTKAPLGGEKTGKNPTDRGKLGTKRSCW